MGCGSSSTSAVQTVPISSNNSGHISVPAYYTEAQAVDESLHTQIHERLRKLEELDAATKVPFILIELTGEGGCIGEIEITGKDEYGVYAALDVWLRDKWNCEPLDVGDLSDDTKIPFCKAAYKWPGYYLRQEEDGLNNFGLRTMQLIDFVCGQLSWTLALMNPGCVGKSGEVREQQLIFKSPHPMNLVAPHMMIELRSAGYVEVSADLEETDKGVLDAIDNLLSDLLQAERLEGYEEFCTHFYKIPEGVFSVSREANNLGIIGTKISDAVVDIKGWSLVSCNAGSYAGGLHRELQLVFRRDFHPLGDEEFLSVQFASDGVIEVTGHEHKDIFTKLTGWLQKQFQATVISSFESFGSKCKRLEWKVQDPLVSSAALTAFFEMQGWELQVCSRQMFAEAVEDNDQVNYVEEQLLMFRPGTTEVGTVEPHLFIEMYAGEGNPEFYEDEEVTQVLANQKIRVKTIGPRTGEGRVKINQALSQLDDFVIDYLGGTKAKEDYTWFLNVFMCRGKFENNLAQWTMRLCDFMVDRLGWSFMECSLCNLGDSGQFRSQQLVFQFDGDKRNVPLSINDLNNQAFCPQEDGYENPAWWQSEEVKSGVRTHQIMRCSEEEKGALQQLLDKTFRRSLTRDRTPDQDAPEDEEMPYRLELVDAFRSEHVLLNRDLMKVSERWEGDLFSVKTIDAVDGTCLAERLGGGQAYFYHGTNPSSSMSILKTGFDLAYAGSATGTMFGAGAYTAECSSKSDEYARDDGGNTYPGLLALLVCRGFVGKPWVTTRPGDFVPDAKRKGLNCICGDRESKVGTYREFVFFEDGSLFPEYSIIYRRQWDKTLVPPEMVKPTTGTTGRFWQMNLPEGWKNVPAEVNKLLLQGMKEGETVVTVTLSGTAYSFNLVERKGTNTSTGNVVALRAPMRSSE